MKSGPNRRAVNRTVRQLRAAGRISDQHRALTEMCRTLADAVDEDPANASLWREYRLAVADLQKLGGDDTDAFKELVDRLRSPVGNSSN